MRTESFKGALLSTLILVSLMVPIIFVLEANDSSSTPHVAPAQIQLSGGSTSEPIQIKAKVFVLECVKDLTDEQIKERIKEANEALKNSGIQLLLAKINRGVPGNAGSRENRDNLRDYARKKMENEGIKGVAIIVAHPGSINHNPNILGVALKGDTASPIVSDNRENDMGKKVWLHEIGHVLCLDDVDNENNIMNGTNSCKEKEFSPEQIERMKKKAENLTIAMKENNKDRTLSDSFFDVFLDVPLPHVDLYTGRWRHNPVYAEWVWDWNVLGLIPRDRDLQLVGYIALDRDNDPRTGMEFAGLPGVNVIVEAVFTGYYPFEPPHGDARITIYNLDTGENIPLLPADSFFDVFVEIETTKLQEPGVGIHENVRDRVQIMVPADNLGALAGEVPSVLLWKDPISGVSDNVLFVVETTPPPAPWLSISGHIGKPGDNILIEGGNFPAKLFFDVFVTLSFGKTDLNVARTTLDENGKFAVSFKVPNVPPGDYYLTAIDNEGNSVFLMFTVEPYRAVEVMGWPRYQSGNPCENLYYYVVVRNLGNVEDNFILSFIPDGWPDIRIAPTRLENVPPGENRVARLTVHVPENAIPCQLKEVVIIAKSESLLAEDNDLVYAHRKRALPKLENLYKVSWDVALWAPYVWDFEVVGPTLPPLWLKAEFRKYDNTLEGENVLWYFDNDPLVALFENVPHPLGKAVERVELSIVDNRGNAVQTVAAFTVARSALLSRISKIKSEWPYADAAKRSALLSEISGIKSMWPYAPP